MLVVEQFVVALVALAMIATQTAEPVVLIWTATPVPVISAIVFTRVCAATANAISIKISSLCITEIIRHNGHMKLTRSLMLRAGFAAAFCVALVFVASMSAQFTPPTFGGVVNASAYGTVTNCSSSAAPALCVAAAAGSVIIPAAGTDVTVNTTAVTANSQIFAIFDQSLGTKLGVTCNSTTANPHIGARVAGTSFTIHANVSPVTNPACFSYFVIN